MHCSNCENPVKNPEKAVIVTRGPDGDVLARICDTCQHQVLTMKIVLGRSNSVGEFMYESYLPVNSVK